MYTCAFEFASNVRTCIDKCIRKYVRTSYARTTHARTHARQWSRDFNPCKWGRGLIDPLSRSRSPRRFSKSYRSFETSHADSVADINGRHDYFQTGCQDRCETCDYLRNFLLATAGRVIIFSRGFFNHPRYIYIYI